MRRVLTGVILSSVLATASCGSNSTGPEEDSLTAGEALALVEISTSQVFQAADNAVVGSETVTPGGSTIELTAPCSMGGTVAANGRANLTGDPVSQRLAASVAVTLVHSGCTERHSEAGITFTLDGAPGLEVSVEVSVGGDFQTGEVQLEISGTLEGTVRWATDDDRSGSCEMDLEIETGLNENFGFTTTITGQACGTQVMESETTELPGI